MYKTPVRIRIEPNQNVTLMFSPSISSLVKEEIIDFMIEIIF